MRRPACPSIYRKWEWASFFNNGYNFFLGGGWGGTPSVVCVTFYDWSAAHSSTNRCNCLRKSCHLSLWAWMGVEWTRRSGLCLLSASVYQRSREQLKQFHVWPSVVLSYSLGGWLLHTIEVQYMFTLICMRYLCVSVIHQSMTRTTGSLTCQHDLFMHAYTQQVFCLPWGGEGGEGGAWGSLFFFHSEGALFFFI